MGEERIELIERQLDEREDEVLALRFAFMALAKALDEREVLPLPVLAEYLEGAADTLSLESGSGSRDLSPVAEQVGLLRDALLRLR